MRICVVSMLALIRSPLTIQTPTYPIPHPPLPLISHPLWALPTPTLKPHPPLLLPQTLSQTPIPHNSRPRLESRSIPQIQALKKGMM